MTLPHLDAILNLPIEDRLDLVEAIWDLREAATQAGLPIVDAQELTTQKLDISDSGSLWIHALVAPFPTVSDGVSSADLINAWKNGSSLTGNGQPLLMAESTLRALAAQMGRTCFGCGAKRCV